MNSSGSETAAAASKSALAARLDGNARRPLLLSWACSLAYLFTKSWQPFPGSIALKVLSILALAVFVLQWRGWLAAAASAPAQAQRWQMDVRLLGFALLLSALGDFFLDLPGNWFVQGLGAFLLAHLVYIALFVRQWRWPLRPSAGQWGGLLVLLTVAFGLTWWLLPGLGKLLVPVLIYNAALTLMVATALLARWHGTAFGRWIVGGALLFLLSDSLIGIHRFRTPVPWREYLVWATYYLAQFFIALGFWRYLREEFDRTDAR